MPEPSASPSYVPTTRPLGRRRFLQLAGAAAAVGVGATAGPAVAAPAGDVPATASAASGQPAAESSGEVAIRWFERLTELVQRTPGYSPPVAARAFGYAGVTLYQAVVAGMPGSRSLAGQLQELPQTPGALLPVGNWPLVANAALAEISRRLFPTAPADQLAAVDALEGELAASLGAGVPSVWRWTARLRGQAVAAVVFDWSTTDGGHQAYLGSPPYVPPVGPGLWRPTPPAYLPALQPTWGNNRTMVPGVLAYASVGPPPPYSADPTSEFYAAALEVKETVDSLTPEQEEIALFWSDLSGETATPAGHWVSILSDVLRDPGATLDLAAEAYARLGIAVNDAFICCWDTKYTYDLLRPVTYIQDHIDPSWLPLFPTPPFPEYTSGHSVQSAASARVLTELLGVVPFTDDTHSPRAVASRSFASFDDAAAEAAVSRLYGGIHYRFGIEEGVRQGHRVGDAVNRLRFGA